MTKPLTPHGLTQQYPLYAGVGPETGFRYRCKFRPQRAGRRWIWYRDGRWIWYRDSRWIWYRDIRGGIAWTQNGTTVYDTRAQAARGAYASA